MKDTTKLLVENVIVPYSKDLSPADIDGIAVSSAKKRIRRMLNCDSFNCRIYRKSIDARRKTAIKFVTSVYAEINKPSSAIKNAEGFRLYENAEYDVSYGKRKLSARPVIAGFGPAGMFCAMALAENGYKPIVYERGGNVSDRVKAVEMFFREGKLDTDSNIQFGAGGAGTFSDGKLTTRINDPLASYVLKRLIELGAPEDIQYKAKPHIGTDVLRNVVANADNMIRNAGGDIHYNSRVDISSGGISVGNVNTDYGVLVLALGHSARDTYKSILESNFSVEPKPFSAGVRIEHLQSDLDCAMYGDFAGDETLGRAEYNVSYRSGDRGVYSFCMCPGGEVVAAASEEFGVVTNGMSNRLRNGKNSNAAIAVSVLPSDFGNTPEGAIEFQRNLERSAFVAGGSNYFAPMQTVGDLLNGKSGTEPSKIHPTYMNGKVTPCDFNSILPGFITEMLKTGISEFGKKIKGFDAPEVTLTGVETRTSAPLRIIRNDKYLALGHDRIYPCGEGAGYAGGIMSAAIDGLKVAKAIMEEYSPF